MSNVVHVAVGVIINDGHILIAKRPAHLHMGGKWEFPGGKVDPGETVQQALIRELHEELNITATTIELVIQISHDYPDKRVYLDVHKVTAFTGAPMGNEGQEIRWVLPTELYNYEFPAANQPIVTAVNLPDFFAITGDYSTDDELLARIDRQLSSGIKLFQFRNKFLDELAYRQLAVKISALCMAHGAKLQLNCSPEWFEFFKDMDCVGLHLTSNTLAKLIARPIPLTSWLSASCHNSAEIQKAEMIGCDFIVLSPVLPTGSHVDAIPLGLSAFSDLVAAAKLPVYGLGGLRQSDLHTLKSLGAQGVAGISAFEI